MKSSKSIKHRKIIWCL